MSENFAVAMNSENFEFEIPGWRVEMSDGELTINDVSYEEHDDEPTYSFVRWMAKAMGLI